MLRFVADENLNNDILRGLLRRCPDLDIIRIQDASLSGADDAAVLDFASRENRVLLTHDVSTLTDHAYQRLADGRRMPGVFEISLDLALAVTIEDLLLLAECSLDGEWEGQVRYLPLR
jgi:hypothetical protein